MRIRARTQHVRLVVKVILALASFMLLVMIVLHVKQQVPLFDKSIASGSVYQERGGQPLFNRSNVSLAVLLQSSPSFNLSSLSAGTTIVTAYINIGRFQKGDDQVFSPALYRRWMTIFARIENPVVAYFDDDNDAAYFRIVRQKLPESLTHIVKIARADMWAFGLEQHIQRIFSQWWYPQHHPNTVSAAYSCAMHAKYELMQRTVHDNPHETKYMTWLDIGLFRELTSVKDTVAKQQAQRKFKLRLPPQLLDDGVAYGEVYPMTEIRRLTLPMDVVGYNVVWVCGCYFVGRVDAMFRWTVEYMNAVERMIEMGAMSTDQQVIYWLKSTNQLKTRIQTYRKSRTIVGDYFYLGYLCKEDELL